MENERRKSAADEAMHPPGVRSWDALKGEEEKPRTPNPSISDPSFLKIGGGANSEGKLKLEPIWNLSELQLELIPRSKRGFKSIVVWTPARTMPINVPRQEPLSPSAPGRPSGTPLRNNGLLAEAFGACCPGICICPKGFKILII